MVNLPERSVLSRNVLKVERKREFVSGRLGHRACAINTQCCCSLMGAMLHKQCQRRKSEQGKYREKLKKFTCDSATPRLTALRRHKINRLFCG
jgi:hypothetical protein